MPEPNSPEDVRERLFKARRLLIGISLVLLAHYVLGIKIKPDAETLGLKFDIEDVRKVIWGLWAVWGWSLATYLQHMHDLGGRLFPRDIIDAQSLRFESWLCRRRLLAQARAGRLANRAPGTPDSIHILGSTAAYSGQDTKPIRSFSYEVRWAGNDTGRGSTPRPDLVGAWRAICSAYCLSYVLLLTRYGTDFYAPLVIAAAPVPFAIWN